MEVMNSEKALNSLEHTFRAELNLLMHTMRALPVEERLAFAKSIERIKTMWKLKGQYESAK